MAKKSSQANQSTLLGRLVEFLLFSCFSILVFFFVKSVVHSIDIAFISSMLFLMVCLLNHQIIKGFYSNMVCCLFKEKCACNVGSTRFKRVLKILYFAILSILVFYLTRRAIVGGVVNLDPNDICAVDMKFHNFISNRSSYCMFYSFYIFVLSLLASVLTFMSLLIRQQDLVCVRTDKEQNKLSYKMFQFIGPVVIAIVVFLLVQNAIEGTTFDPMGGYLCPMDWGPGSANWACQDSLAKMSSHVFFVTKTFPAMICGGIAFLVSLPKTVKYYKWILWSLIGLMIGFSLYFIIFDYIIIFEALYTLDWFREFVWKIRL